MLFKSTATFPLNISVLFDKSYSVGFVFFMKVRVLFSPVPKLIFPILSIFKVSLKESLFPPLSERFNFSIPCLSSAKRFPKLIWLLSVTASFREIVSVPAPPVIPATFPTETLLNVSFPLPDVIF